MSVAEQQILRANVAQASSETERREKSDIDRHSGRGTEARGKKKEASHNYHARLVLVSRVNFTPINAALKAPRDLLRFTRATYLFLIAFLKLTSTG